MFKNGPIHVCQFTDLTIHPDNNHGTDHMLSYFCRIEFITGGYDKDCHFCFR
jgi:hypothetical protein